jgi:hypothetical protein
MLKTVVAVVIGAFFALVGFQPVYSQISKKAEEKVGTTDPQKKSWEQVDQINQMPRKTKGQPGTGAEGKKTVKSGKAEVKDDGGYKVKKSKPAKKSSYKRSPPPKKR